MGEVDELKQQVAAEREAVQELDASLDPLKTPYLKSKLAFANGALDLAESELREQRVHYVAMFIKVATDTRLQVQEDVDKYGGPASVKEVPAKGRPARVRAF